jgi:inosine-uridine nucleoside N-ribohydrolase
VWACDRGCVQRGNTCEKVNDPNATVDPSAVEVVLAEVAREDVEALGVERRTITN